MDVEMGSGNEQPFENDIGRERTPRNQSTSTRLRHAMTQEEYAYARIEGQMREKNLADAYKLMDMATPEMLKEGVAEAMAELKKLGAVYEAHPTLAVSRSVRSAINKRIVYILACNGVLGRSDEWQRLTREYVEEQLSLNKEFIVCERHRTAEYYGSAAKWLAPGTIKAMKVYLTFPSTSPLFLAPLSERGTHVSMSWCLRTYWAELGYSQRGPGVNLMRKMFHTKLCNKVNQLEEGFTRLLERVHCHSSTIVKKVYRVRTPEDDSDLAKLLYKAVMGEPVPWPTDSDIETDERLGVLALVDQLGGPGNVDNACVSSEEEGPLEVDPAGGAFVPYAVQKASEGVT